MSLDKKIDFANNYLLAKMPQYKASALDFLKYGGSKVELNEYLRTVFLPKSLSVEYLNAEKDILQSLFNKNLIIRKNDCKKVESHIYLAYSKLFYVEAEAVVNDANQKLIGCFRPMHNCIDNQIHRNAGLGLRLECMSIMAHEDHDEFPGSARITNSYNLIQKYVIHTVSPTVFNGIIEDYHKMLLESCYKSILEVCEKNKIKSVVIPPLGIGKKKFPSLTAAYTAVEVVKKHTKKNEIDVIFCLEDKDTFNLFNKLI